MNDSDSQNDTSVWVCDDCQERWYYGRALCPACGCASVDSADLGVGRLVATTTARVTPPDVRAENPLGLARFADDVAVIAQLPADESHRPTVGDEVNLVGDETLRDRIEGPRLHPADETGVTKSTDVDETVTETERDSRAQ
ncbi:MAG: Zn-ribbon domain-containing OB-fold protein [Haloplanus sp.]